VVGRAQPFDALDSRGLAGAVRAEDAEDLSGFDGERDVLDRDRLAVAFLEVLDVDD
jgi:hypothetical protein